MEIVRARPEDVPAIAALERECFPADPWPEGLIARMAEDFVLAVEDGALLGYLVLTSVLDEGSIDNVATAPAYRRRGVADALLEDAVRRSRERSLSFLLLEVRASNTPAVRLYEKHGFREVGRRRNYYQKPKEDAILMTKEL